MPKGATRMAIAHVYNFLQRNGYINFGLPRGFDSFHIPAHLRHEAGRPVTPECVTAYGHKLLAYADMEARSFSTCKSESRCNGPLIAELLCCCCCMSKLLTTCHDARLQKMTERMARTLAEAALCLEPGAIKADPDLKKAFAVALAGALGSHALPDWAVAAKVRDCGSCSQHVLFVSLYSWLWVRLSLPIIQR
jgi:hypothetical protein